ncbi:MULTISPECIES: cytochrome P450 [Pseudonocardia]|uniref:cytochrome P450 n=1 Tax=Pseudonocardia TaxID=1847 RepID=UPI001AD74170|nr:MULTISPECIES: cytochrome P450 [Pseudonocardia]MBO4241356.1 cytochrome P450 [Pseudonocardia alni]
MTDTATDFTLPLHMRRDRFLPDAELERIRDSGDVPRVRTAFGAEAYLVTRYDDVRHVLGDAATYSNAGSAELTRPDAPPLSEREQEQMRAGQLLLQDPPEHTRLRRFLTREFTQRRMARLEPRITEIVDEHLDALEAAGPGADLVALFALPVPSMVICELLGVPYTDRDEFTARSTRLLDVSLPAEERLAVGRENRAYMARLVDAALADPGEDILGMLIREHGEEISHDELVGIASLLLIAGHETTSNMLSLGTLALLEDPEQAALLRSDPGLARPAVEELLRWLSIVHTGVVRVTTTDTVLRDTPIPARSLVMCSLPTANRDTGSGFDDPARLDLTRGAAGHVAFGHGVHHCLGAPLARMEMATAFPALLRRFPTLAPAGPVPPEAFRAYHFVYGMHTLPVTW